MIKACDPNIDLKNLQKIIKLNTGQDVNLTKEEACKVYQNIEDGVLPLPPLILDSSRTYLLDKNSPLTVRDYDILFRTASTKNQLKRVARKVGIKKMDQITKSDIVDAIGERLQFLNIREPIRIGRKSITRKPEYVNTNANANMNMNLNNSSNNNMNINANANSNTNTNMNVNANVNTNMNVNANANVNMNLNSENENTNVKREIKLNTPTFIKRERTNFNTRTSPRVMFPKQAPFFKRNVTPRFLGGNTNVIRDGPRMFFQSDQFIGARPGFAFKTGPLGVGYYRNIPPTPVKRTNTVNAKNIDTGTNNMNINNNANMNINNKVNAKNIGTGTNNMNINNKVDAGTGTNNMKINNKVNMNINNKVDAGTGTNNMKINNKVDAGTGTGTGTNNMKINNKVNVGTGTNSINTDILNTINEEPNKENAAVQNNAANRARRNEEEAKRRAAIEAKATRNRLAKEKKEARRVQAEIRALERKKIATERIEAIRVEKAKENEAKEAKKAETEKAKANKAAAKQVSSLVEGAISKIISNDKASKAEERRQIINKLKSNRIAKAKAKAEANAKAKAEANAKAKADANAKAKAKAEANAKAKAEANAKAKAEANAKAKAEANAKAKADANAKAKAEANAKAKAEANAKAKAEAERLREIQEKERREKERRERLTKMLNDRRKIFEQRKSGRDELNRHLASLKFISNKNRQQFMKRFNNQNANVIVLKSASTSLNQALKTERNMKMAPLLKLVQNKIPGISGLFRREWEGKIREFKNEADLKMIQRDILKKAALRNKIQNDEELNNIEKRRLLSDIMRMSTNNSVSEKKYEDLKKDKVKAKALKATENAAKAKEEEAAKEKVVSTKDVEVVVVATNEEKRSAVSTINRLKKLSGARKTIFKSQVGIKGSRTYNPNMTKEKLNSIVKRAINEDKKVK